jgi:hypothetical protein
MHVAVDISLKMLLFCSRKCSANIFNQIYLILLDINEYSVIFFKIKKTVLSEKYFLERVSEKGHIFLYFFSES